MDTVEEKYHLRFSMGCTDQRGCKLDCVEVQYVQLQIGQGPINPQPVSFSHRDTPNLSPFSRVLNTKMNNGSSLRAPREGRSSKSSVLMSEIRWII